MSEDLSRRKLLALTGAALASATAASAYQSAKKLYLYASSWTKGPVAGTGGSGGISVFTVNMNDGSLTPVGKTAPEFDNVNGGCCCIAPNGRSLYCTNEIKNLPTKSGSGGFVLAFAIDQKDGSLRHLNTQSSMGANPTWVQINAAGTRVVVANHGTGESVVRVEKRNGVPEMEALFDDGSISMFEVKPDGGLEPACDVAVFERTHGGGPRGQASSHAHCANFDPSQRFLLACDPGCDYIYVYRVDPGSRTLPNGKSFQTRPGTAPRHSAFHPRLPYVFVSNEEESSLDSYHFDSKAGNITPIQTVPTIPAGFTARNQPAAIRIHPNGKFVYGSNRGHQSIAIFRIEEPTGKLSPVDIVPVGGSTARECNFEPSGKYMFVANMGSNDIVTFAVDSDTGKMTPTGAKTEISRPSSMQFVAL